MLAVAGQGPADVLAALNRDFGTDDQPPLASLVLAEIAADGRSVAWAQAGHYSPILVHDGKARAVRRPRGDLLGLSPTTQYGRGTIQLGPGDLLVCFTDGVFQHWGGSEAPVRRLANECEEAQREGGLAALLRRVLPPAEDEACLVALAWPTAG
jgi:serine phosphatase RsbU (regulator of sigma subunit)